jgi:hypothetical protein
MNERRTNACNDAAYQSERLLGSGSHRSSVTEVEWSRERRASGKPENEELIFIHPARLRRPPTLLHAQGIDGRVRTDPTATCGSRIELSVRAETQRRTTDESTGVAWQG